MSKAMQSPLQISPGSSRRLVSRSAPEPGSQVEDNFRPVIAPDPQCVDDTIHSHPRMAWDRTRGDRRMFGVRRNKVHASYPRLVFLVIVMFSLAPPLSAAKGASLPVVRTIDEGVYEGHPDDPPHSYPLAAETPTYQTTAVGEGAWWSKLVLSVRSLVNLVRWGVQ